MADWMKNPPEPLTANMQDVAQPSDKDRIRLALLRMTKDKQRDAATEKQQAAEQLRAKRYETEVTKTEERRKERLRAQEIKRRCPADVFIPSHVKLANGRSYPLTPQDLKDIERVVTRQVDVNNAAMVGKIDGQVDKRLANQLTHIADGKKELNREFRGAQSEGALTATNSRDRGLGD